MLDALAALLQPSALAASALAYVLWTVTNGIYNLCLHPLAKFPGPRWAAFSRWWMTNLEIFQGKNLAEELVTLHATYGDVVRIGPNELHFAKSSVYHEIYNPRNRWSRDPQLYHVFSMSESLLTMMEYTKAKTRKDILQPLFSRKAIIDLQYLVQDMVNKMCANMEEQANEGKFVNIFYAYRSFALDGITSFCFGTSMNATQAPDFKAPINIAMHASMPIVPTLRHFPLLKKTIEVLPSDLVSFLQPEMRGLMEMRKSLKRQVQDILKHPEILQSAPHRTIFHELLNEEHGHRLPSFTSLRDEALLMVFAGTDTSSTTLTLGSVYVLDDPEVHRKLDNELLKAWPNIMDRPRFEDLDGLPYLKAVIKESLRLSHGVWSPMTRIVPREGAQINGHFIPGGTIVGISNRFVHLDPEIFPDPHVFKPERWLETKGEGESLDYWLVAFSKGPRSCLGMNLGWCELVLGFANAFRRFDLKLDGVHVSQLHWKECYIPHYDGPELKVIAKPRTS